MSPNVGSKWKRKKDPVNTLEVWTTGRLVTFTTEIFGIPLMKHSRYALKHCFVDVEGDKRARYATKEAAVFAACIRRHTWNIRTNAARPGMVYQHGLITFSHFTDRMIP